MPYFKEKYHRTIRQAAEKIETIVYSDRVPLSVEIWKSKEPLTFENRMSGQYAKIKAGDKWGDRMDCAWFLLKGKIPKTMKGKDVVLLIDLNGEGLLVNEKGEPLQGLTSKRCWYPKNLGSAAKTMYRLERDSGDVEFWIDAGCNDLGGFLIGEGRLKEADIAVIHENRYQIFWDMVTLLNYLDTVEKNSSLYNTVLFKMYEAIVNLKDYSDEELCGLKRTLDSLFFKGGESPLCFTAIGHAHIDLAWRWPIRETKRKAARTFSTVLKNMERYPEYKFGASQPQLYQWIKEDYPTLYERIKEKVMEGRWEVQGAMWVEADANLSGGEALVRQLLYGKRYFLEEFGKEVKTLWLPDVFGYNASMPQLLKKSGCDYFMTQKLSWNEHNKFPHQTFIWKGIDGSEVFAHMLPEETYNSPLTPSQMKFAETNYAESGLCNEALILFGIGDGGGGPGENHLETARRVENLNGVCPVTQGFAEPLMKRMAQKNKGRLPVWSGELYLEKHQGTYTTQALNKYWNRRSEMNLRELEFAYCLCGGCTSEEKAELDMIWKEILLYQFHDILPGSSIQRVNDESCKRYEVLNGRIEEQIRNIYQNLSGNAPLMVFNPLSFDRNEIIKQGGRYYRVYVPAMGETTRLVELTDSTVIAQDCVLENEILRAEFSHQGELISLVDKRSGLESISCPCGIFKVYQDVNADCWDIAIEYTDRMPESFQLVSQSFASDAKGGVCHQEYEYGKSRLFCDISLDDGSELLSYSLIVDWHEREKMLRLSFDTTIITDKASFEIQYGIIQRPNNDNTLLQLAQFEECGHKWVDLSSESNGVALLNDCKYGYRIKENVIDVNLLRSQVEPGIGADEGLHKIRLALYPHGGNIREAKVTEKALAFNMPLRFVVGDPEGDRDVHGSKICAEGGIIEALKPSEDGRGIILRIYEPYGGVREAVIQLDREYHFYETDLMENKIGEEHVGNRIETRLSPFEIQTFRLI